MVAGIESRDNPPIDPLTTNESKRLATSDVADTKGHKADTRSLVQILNLALLQPVGRYWIFSMRYHHRTSKELLKLKVSIGLEIKEFTMLLGILS